MKLLRNPFRSADTGVLKAAGLALASSFLITGCFDGSSSSSSDSSVNEQLFPADGKFEATIRRTTNGVPHVKADNLASAAFGHGYVQAQDNVCLLAEAFVKARSERAKYFGPGNDSINIINDFSYKAQDILSGAKAEFPQLSEESRAMVEGFTAGYNRYVGETDPGALPAECRDQPWVKEIEPTDLLAHYRIVGQFASGAQFATGLAFAAVPPGESADPVLAQPMTSTGGAIGNTLQVAKAARENARKIDNFADMGLASNAWGIGSELTENGKGALLANPHFPYTGHRRLYQAQLTVPGYLNVNGAGLLGTAIPLINFNENLAWSHTVTTSRRFTWYELELKPGDPLTYIKDGVEKPITSKTFQVEVNMGAPEPVVLERTFWFSEYGPMLAANEANDAFPEWGGTGLVNGEPAAYTYRDANANTSGLLDTWLGMSRATNLEEFKDVFRQCGTTLWTNTTYADDQGNAYFIDSSSVPNLSDASLAVLDFKRTASPAFDQLFNNNVTLLDGSKSRDDWVEGECAGLVPFEDKPKLQRTDWVQNSNSSHWATNPDEFLTGFSPLFGPENKPVNPRTRLGIKMLQNPTDPGLDSNTIPPAGQDGKFSAKDLIDTIWNNRAWYAEQFLPELQERCALITDPVSVPQGLLPSDPEVISPGTQDVTAGCDALNGWNGTYDLTSTGAHLFRAFIDIYNRSFPKDLDTEFDPADPVNTPADPSADGRGTADDAMLQSLAAAMVLLDDAGIALDSPLSEVQYYQPSGGVPPGGDPTSAEALASRIPWHGGDGNVEGAFNAIGVVDNSFAEDTRIPRLNTPDYEGVKQPEETEFRFAGGLSSNEGEGWLMARGTSWHFGLEFTEDGPQAYGLTSYSQSSDAESDFFVDQSVRYSQKDARKLFFTDEEIEQNLLSGGVITISD
ncbi:penicillin acylase family protein [Marinobacter sp. ATCH36]|uniref:penicillin acylase family protein n=1 Tax=Marinobacter sp. ATCH36 TaxID=2945106 RepID=UPI002021F562|nr:penicillin acylase family protein [Marinobacter sp. ATCH36]MCL7943998.1 penicillin acylase family protein [Marinobacter sp. ATCH36]